MPFVYRQFHIKALLLLVTVVLFFTVVRNFFSHPYPEDNEQRSVVNPHALSLLAAQQSETGSAMSSTRKSNKDPEDWDMKKSSEDPEDWDMKNGSKDPEDWGMRKSSKDPEDWDVKKEDGGQSSDGGSLIWANGSGLVDKVREMFRQNGVVLFTLINDDYLDFAASWCCNTRSFPQLHQRIIFLVTDLPTARQLRVFCSGVTVAVASSLSDQFSGVLNYSRAGYVRLMVERISIVLRLLEAGVQLLQFEVDFVWFKDPMSVVLSRQAGADIVVSKSNGAMKACGCFLFLNPTAATLSFWRRYVETMDDLYQRIKKYDKGKKVPGSWNTQVLMNKLLNNSSGIRIDYLPFDDFPDGKWYGWPRSRQQKLQPYFIHNNWIVGARAKRRRAKAYGHWFWDSSSNTCNSSALRRWKL